MIRYIIKRLLLLILVLFGVMLFVFIVSRCTGDAVMSILGDSYTPEAYQKLYVEMGFDKPYVIQFFEYVWNVLHGNLGVSYFSKMPVSSEVLIRFPDSIKIAIFSMLWSVPIGVFCGTFAAVKQYSAWDYSLTTLALIFNSIPGFWAALLLLLIFSLGLGWLPATGISTWKHYILPCVALGLHPLAYMARLSRTTFLDVIRQDYIRTARSKGLSESAVIFKHAFQNAAIPLITQLSTNFAILVGSSAVVENIFMIPALGNYVTSSINYQDYPAVQGAVLMFSVFVSTVNLLVDIAYGFVDPRIKAKYNNTASLKDKIVTWKLAKEAGGKV